MRFIAHRGYSEIWPENSLPSFKAVIDHPLCGTLITGIELDIHLTADGKIPVMHETVLTDISEKKHTVATCTFDELTTISRAVKGTNASRIPPLEEVLELINHKTELNLEVKAGNYNLQKFVKTLARLLVHYKPHNDVVISSFSFDLLEYLRRHLSKFAIKYAFIFQSADALQSVPKGVRSRFDLLHPHYNLLVTTPAIFSTPTPIRCWTVNDLTTMQQITALSSQLPIEAIMTDNLTAVAEFATLSA